VPERRFLVLHGLGNRRPPEHWHWWLVDQLRTRGEQALYPQLPSPERPDLGEWLDLLGAEYAQLGDGERIVVCHSLAVMLWFHAATLELLDRPAGRVLLVAPPGPSMLAASTAASFWITPDRDALRASSRVPIRLVGSDDDPECAEGPAATVFGGPLDLDAETIPGAGHITIASGYGPWPAALEWCLDPATRFAV
jgi:uncharacterized protein